MAPTRILAFLLAFVAISSTDGGEGFDFRQTRWGISESAVILAEGERPYLTSKYEGFLVFGYLRIMVADLDSTLFYYFAKEKLVRARYAFPEQYLDYDQHIRDYRALRDLLSTKYGEPDDTVNWFDDTFKDDPRTYGNAIVEGDLSLSSVWWTQRSRITLELFSKDFEVIHRLDYDSIEYADLIEWALRGSILEDL